MYIFLCMDVYIYNMYVYMCVRCVLYLYGNTDATLPHKIGYRYTISSN